MESSGQGVNVGGWGGGVVEFRLRVEEGSQPAEQQRTEGGCGG